MPNVKEKIFEQISKTYPDLVDDKVRDLLSDRLVSPFHISLPKSVLTEAKKIALSINQLRTSREYLEKVIPVATSKHSEFLNLENLNSSIFSSFDFHINNANQLKLIEINTNAAFGALGPFLFKAQGLPSLDENFHQQTLKKMILNELSLFQNQKTEKLRIAIIDENPEQQRLYLEFLIFKKIFESYGWHCEILNSLQLDSAKISQFDFIYNRTTDFYFEKPEHAALKNAYLQHSVCISPHPYEYFLLADKERMSVFPELTVLSDIEENLLKTVKINSTNQPQIWTDRKQLFFKPSNEYGSKKSFRGGTISRKLFEEIATESMVAQEFVPAPVAKFNADGIDIEFKYDLRFYFYQEDVQFVVARLYQGQVTNAQAENGGFAPVQFV